MAPARPKKGTAQWFRIANLVRIFINLSCYDSTFDTSYLWNVLWRAFTDSPAARLVLVGSWFFTTIVISMYTANLTVRKLIVLYFRISKAAMKLCLKNIINKLKTIIMLKISYRTYSKLIIILPERKMLSHNFF